MHTHLDTLGDAGFLASLRGLVMEKAGRSVCVPGPKSQGHSRVFSCCRDRAGKGVSKGL